MIYSDKVIEHFDHPRNVGSLAEDAKNVGTGTVASPECGDVIRVQIQVGEQGRIIDAKFKTFGCAAAVAASSLITEWLKGRPVEQACRLKSADIAAELSLPPGKLHCSVMTEEAVAAAILDWKRKNGSVTIPTPSAER